MFAVQSCAVCSKSFDLSLHHCPHCHATVAGATDPGRPPPSPLEAMLDFVDGEVNEEEELRTGMWHALDGPTLEGLGVGSSQQIPAGVSVRRIGDEIEVQKVDATVMLTVDGVEVSAATVSLRSQAIAVGGVLITEAMVPRDTLELSQLPDFFEPVSIGRSDHSDFHVGSKKVSSHHAVLSRHEGYVLLEDQDSFNGTFVEGRRVKRARIGWRQKFRVADQELTPLKVMQRVVADNAASKTSLVNVMPMMDEVYRMNNPSGLASHSQPRLDVALTESGSPSPVASFEEDSLAKGVVAALGDTQRMRMGGLISASRRLTVGQSLVVGRDPTADVVLMTPNVSHFHARITRGPDGMVVEDLGSTNGTWLNGVRVSGAVALQPDDDLRLGPHRVEINEDMSIAREDLAGGARGVRLDAHDLVRQVGPKSSPITVVDRVSFTILPGEMVAVMGPSGAGKTSVLTTLAGYTPPTEGHVYMDGYSLYHHYDVFRSAVGYVPQEDVMHRTLSVREVLYYHARLEFSAEVSDQEIEERISTVLTQLDLSHVAKTIVGDENVRGLSGGQRKRLNVAMEMMSEPSLLILDEPTSGLDARSAMELIRQCRDLATAGRTVVMTIHQPRLEAFELFDKILLLTTGGKVAYFGPPGRVEGAKTGEDSAGVRAYFEKHSLLPSSVAQNPADYALDALDPIDPALKREPSFWDGAYRASASFKKFMKERGKGIEEEQNAQLKLGGLRKQRKARFFRQLRTLTMRYAKIKWRDRTSLVVQLAQAPIIAGLALLLFHKGQFKVTFLKDDVTPAIFVLMAAAVWFGCSNVAREIVGERAIYRRERMGRLRPGAYLLSKVLMQGLLIGIQVGILLVVLIPGVGLGGGVFGLVSAVLLVAWSSMALGLLLSTLARTELQAIQFVPLAILPQIMLSGILIPVAGGKASAMAVWLSKPVLLRWAYSAGLWVEFGETTIRGECVKNADKIKNYYCRGYWDRIGFQDDLLSTDFMVIGGLGLACLLVSFVVLSRRDTV